MAIYYSQGSSNWSTLTNWDTNTGGGGSDPASVAAMAGNEFVIQASHNILMDCAITAAGITGLTIQGSATDPGMLYFKDGTSGLLIIQPSTGVSPIGHIIGTSAALKGRILASQTGLWITTGGLAEATKGTGAVISGGIFTPASTPSWIADTLIGESMQLGPFTFTANATTNIITTTSTIANATRVYVKSDTTLPSPLKEETLYYARIIGGSLYLSTTSNGDAIDLTDNGWGTHSIWADYVIADNSTTAITSWTGIAPADGTTGYWTLIVRPLPQDHTAKISLLTTAQIDAQYLDIMLLGGEPITKSIRCYGQIWGSCVPTAASDIFTYTAHGMQPGLMVTVAASAGKTIPRPLVAGTEYYIIGTGSGGCRGTDTFKLSLTPAGAALDILDNDTNYNIDVFAGLYSNVTRSDSTIIKANMGLTNGTAIMFKTTGTLPSPLQPATMYFASTPVAYIASSTNATPIQITTYVAHGYSDGDIVRIAGHSTNTNANGCWIVADSDGNTKFTLTTTAGNSVGNGVGVNGYCHKENGFISVRPYMNSQFDTNVPTIVLTDGGSGTHDIYTGTIGGEYFCTGGLSGVYKVTTHTTVRLLDDITSQSTYWVPGSGTSITTTGLNAMVLYNESPTSLFDIERLCLASVTATTAVLSDAVDSYQWPNSRLWLVSRNVAILSACVTNFNVIDYSTATTSSGIFGCEVRSTAATVNGGTSYGYGISYGTSHIISGCISSWTYGIQHGNYHTISGLICGHSSYSIYYGSNHTISGTLAANYYHIYYGASHNISATMRGGYTAIYGGFNHTISGPIIAFNYGITSVVACNISSSIRECFWGMGTASGVYNINFTGSISGCYYGVYYVSSSNISGTISGCLYGFVQVNACSISASINGCYYGYQAGTGVEFYNATFSNNTYDIYNNRSVITGYGVTLGSGIQDYNMATGYNTPTYTEWVTHCFYNYGGTLGYIKAFMPCGTVTTIVTPTPPVDTIPAGTYAYKMMGDVPGTGGLQRACFLDIPLYGKSGIPMEITIYEKCSINPSLFLEGPGFAIYDPSKLLRDATGILNNEGLVTAQSLGDDTDWHTTRLTYTPLNDRPLVLRSYAKCTLATTSLVGANLTGVDCAVVTASPDATHCSVTPIAIVMPNWGVNALTGMYVRFESDLTYYYISSNTATVLTIISTQATNANRGAWTIVSDPTSAYYYWMYNIDSMQTVAANKVLNGTPRWTGATAPNIGSLNVNYSY